MIAAVYSREIREQYDCGDCVKSPYQWDQLGRCTGPIMDYGEPSAVQLRMEGEQYQSGDTYPEKFETCPMGLLRGDLRPAQVGVAVITSHAASAELDKRYPEIPARLYGLIDVWRRTESARRDAEHEASMRGIKGRRHGSD